MIDLQFCRLGRLLARGAFMSLWAGASPVLAAPDAGGGAPPLAASRVQLLHKGPLIETGCLKELANPSGYFEQDGRWGLACSLDELKKGLEQDGNEPSDPGLRLVVARLLKDQIRVVKAQLERENLVALPQSTAESAEGSLMVRWLSRLGIGISSPEAGSASLGMSTEPQARNQELPKTQGPTSREGRLLSQTEPILEALRVALEPLMQKDSLFRPQAAMEIFEAYGASLRFQAAHDFLKDGALDARARGTRERILDSVMDWVDKEGGGPLREWLATELAREQGSEITAAHPQLLAYWLRALELKGPVEAEKKDEVLARLRRLWIAYPRPDHARQIRETAERIGVSRDFKAPTIPDMDVRELLLKTQAHVRDIDGLLARRTIQRVLELPAVTLSRELHWEALQLHIRVLRILDQRPAIPAVLKAYLERGRFLKHVAGEEPREFYGRILDVARHTWTYDPDPQKALELLELVLEKNPRGRPRAPEGQVAMALYIRARIEEQAGRVAVALGAIDRALEMRKFLPQENTADLLMRRFLLIFDEAQRGARPVAEAQAALEALKGSNQAPFDRARWHFWSARVNELAKKIEEAKAQFRLAYKADPYSFYSNLSGLELARLKDRPSDWVIGFEGEPARPDVESFVGKAKGGKKIHAAMARVWHLARVADRAGVDRALPELGREAADEIMNSKSTARERRNLARAVVWLRRAVGDAYGSLRTSEVARTSLGSDFSAEDFGALYPLPYWSSIQAEAASNHLDPWLVASLIRQESAFDPQARSPANALGLMQMIPPVAQADAKALGLEGFVPEDLYEPSTALRLGTFHLGGLIKEFESSWISSIAAYNAGRPPVQKWLGYYKDGDPLAFVERISYQETRNYVRSILRNYINYQRIYGKGEIEMRTLLQMPGQPVPRVSPSPGDPLG